MESSYDAGVMIFLIPSFITTETPNWCLRLVYDPDKWGKVMKLFGRLGAALGGTDL